MTALTFVGEMLRPYIRAYTYTHIKSNQPSGNVKIYIVRENSEVTSCECNANDPNPCGYDSNCRNRSMCTECYIGTCTAGAKCQNQKFQKLEYPAVKVKCTETRGYTLKSGDDMIKKGMLISEYCGDLIDHEEYEKRTQEKQLKGDTNFYFCTLDSHRIIDAEKRGNFSRFMNHSCEPNCEMKKWMVLGDVRVGLFASKDIKADSELSFDYRQMDVPHYAKMNCECGSNMCSGLIGGEK